MNNKTFPTSCSAVQETVDQVYYPYNAARMLIGGLAGDPPAKTPMTIQTDSSTGRVTGRIGTGIPGARSVDLAPLLDRCRRLAALEEHRRDLMKRLDGVDAHPWAKHRR